jgi:hypothetical protein
MSQVTGLQVITNNYGSQIEFANAENDGNNRSIPNNNTTQVGNAWIPWCDSSDAYPQHHMSLQSDDGTLKLYIWQHGSNIRYSANNVYDDNAPAISGDSTVGQSVALVVGSNGSLTMSQWN